MLDVYYYSMTGNIPRFLKKCDIEGRTISGKAPAAPFVLVTNTLGFGEVPPPVADFLAKNGEMLVGVAASGNRNWGDNYGRAARLISRQYEVPIIHIFEMSGLASDVITFKEGMRSLDEIH